MTKKHFIQFAKYIKHTAHSEESGSCHIDTARAMANMVCMVAAGDNPKFDRARFFKACGL